MAKIGPLECQHLLSNKTCDGNRRVSILASVRRSVLARIAAWFGAAVPPILPHA
jgi:hypothetical protein